VPRDRAAVWLGRSLALPGCVYNLVCSQADQETGNCLPDAHANAASQIAIVAPNPCLRCGLVMVASVRLGRSLALPGCVGITGCVDNLVCSQTDQETGNCLPDAHANAASQIAIRAPIACLHCGLVVVASSSRC
jgi:hypothetical protein